MPIEPNMLYVNYVSIKKVTYTYKTVFIKTYT